MCTDDPSTHATYTRLSLHQSRLAFAVVKLETEVNVKEVPQSPAAEVETEPHALVVAPNVEPQALVMATTVVATTVEPQAFVMAPNVQPQALAPPPPPLIVGKWFIGTCPMPLQLALWLKEAGARRRRHLPGDAL